MQNLKLFHSDFERHLNVKIFAIQPTFNHLNTECVRFFETPLYLNTHYLDFGCLVFGENCALILAGKHSSQVHICAMEYRQLVRTCTYANLS